MIKGPFRLAFGMAMDPFIKGVEALKGGMEACMFTLLIRWGTGVNWSASRVADPFNVR